MYNMVAVLGECFFNVFLTKDENVGRANSISPPIYLDISGDISISILVSVKIEKKARYWL